MQNPEGAFTIKRNWKFLAGVALFGLVVAAFGECFLFCNLHAPDEYCKWCGIIATFVGAALICWPVIHITAPLLRADRAGVWFDIAVSGGGIFIPWDGITDVRKENFGWVRSRWKKSTTPCLVFEVREDFVRKIPAILKSAYYKSNNRLYFAAGMLSVPVDEAVHSLLSIKKSGI